MGMDTVELIMKIEDHFGIAIPNAEAEKIYIVQDLYDVVRRHVRSEDYSEQIIQANVNSILGDHAGLKMWEIEPHKSITHDLGLD